MSNKEHLSKAEPVQQISIRFPESLLEWLREQADDGGRTFNGQVIYLLRKAKDEAAAKDTTA